MKKRIIYFMLLLFIGAPILQSCGSTRKCKTSKYKSKPAKCWNAKKQKYTRC